MAAPAKGAGRGAGGPREEGEREAPASKAKVQGNQGEQIYDGSKKAAGEKDASEANEPTDAGEESKPAGGAEDADGQKTGAGRGGRK